MSTGHVDELLPELVLGTLPPPERARAEAHVRGCARCEAELAQTAELLALAGEASAPASAPSPAVRERLLASIAGTGRLHRFARKVAALLDVTVEKARAVLDRVDDESGWQPLPFAGVTGIRLQTVEAGPRLRSAAVAVLRAAPGTTFPAHRHFGAEQVLILAGGYRDDGDGREFGPGDLHDMAAGTGHSWTATDGPDCICIGVVLDGIELGGTRIPG